MPHAILRRARIERWITYVLWAVMAGSIVWGTAMWVDYLSERAAEAEQQTRHMAELLKRSERRQEQMGTLIREFRASVAEEEASRREFERKADAILEALDVQVERMSHKPVGSAPRVWRVVGQAGAAPRPREPPDEAEPAAEPEPADEQRPTHDHPPEPPEHDHPPNPKPRAQPAPPPRSQPPPQANNPPRSKQQPSANSQQTHPGPSRPGKADPPGKAKGHHKQSPGKAKGKR